MAKQLTYNATLVAREDCNDGLAIFKVRPDEFAPSAEWFIPGQYLTLGLNNESQPKLGPVRRPMSIASPPAQPDTVDFYIRYVSQPESDNPLTHLLWEIAPGDRLHISGRPTGRFTVTHATGEDDTRRRVLVAAGTGLAPFTSMVFAAVDQDENVDLSNWAILHAASYPADIGYRAELEALVERNGLRYAPSISRPQEAPDWDAHSGRVEDFFSAERLADTESVLGLAPGSFTPDNAVIYICGLNGTIANTLERALPRGFIPNHRKIRRALEVADDTASSFFFEPYDNTPVVDIKSADNVARLQRLLPNS
jgi:ferredoxin/flavodoxin---NADP+ reductase